jgi:hypothetical protein
MCERWKNSFADFIADVGRRPGPKYSIDRWPDGNGNYEPGNVRWATSEQQSRNKPRQNVYLTFRGETKPVVDWAAEVGISSFTLYQRVEQGWSTERTLTEPAKLGRRPSEHTKYPNISFHKKTAKYFAYQGVGKDRKYCGSFSTLEEAAKVAHR